MIVDRSERLYGLAMRLRQIGRVQFGRIFGTAPSTSGRYKAMIDLLERCYFMRAEINALTGILLEKGVLTEAELARAFDREFADYLAACAKEWPEIEFRDDGFTIKNTAAFAERVKREGWPP